LPSLRSDIRLSGIGEAAVVRGQVQSVLDFGPVVKPLGTTVKKEGGKVVETSGVVRSRATSLLRKEGQEPLRVQNCPKKGGPKNF